jgi:hypothetical protein
MPVCIVYGSKNSTNIKRKRKGVPENSKVTVTKVSFYSFPEDGSLRQQWVHLCKIKDKFNPARARICSDHFKEEELHWDLKHKLLQYSPRKSREVRPGVLPSLKLPLNSVQMRNASVSSMKGNAGRLMLCEFYYMLDRKTLCLQKTGQ